MSAIRREVIIGDCRLLLGDCLPIMRQLPNVDAVLTDPPYGIGADKSAAKNKGKWGWTYYGESEWDNNRPCAKTFEEILRIAPHQIVWGGNYFTDHLPPRMRWLVWDKVSVIFRSPTLKWLGRLKTRRLAHLTIRAPLHCRTGSSIQRKSQSNLCAGALAFCETHEPSSTHSWAAAQLALPASARAVPSSELR